MPDKMKLFLFMFFIINGNMMDEDINRVVPTLRHILEIRNLINRSRRTTQSILTQIRLDIIT